MALDLHCHFDGGNQADSRLYDHFTLTAVSGVPRQWQRLEHEWDRKCTKHHISYFHATEHKKYLDLMEDFAVTAYENAYQIRPQFSPGLYTFSATVPLKDHKRACADNPLVPRNVDEILLREVIYRCVEWGRERVAARNYHLIFGGDEPGKGILAEIHSNPEAVKEYPFLEDWDITSSNMRRKPGLQLADLFAFSHANRKQYNSHRWHQMVMGIEQDIHDFTYEELIDPHLPTIEKSKLWGIAKRKETR